jgi:acyl-CoA thioesterase-2
VTGSNWASSLRQIHVVGDGDQFVAEPNAGGGRLFGGLVLAYTLAAAAETVETRFLPQSLHAYFVRGGTPGVPITLDVTRVRDGRAFATRRVTAAQEGRAILEMLGSFHIAETGEDWHPAPPNRDEPTDAQPVERPRELDVFDLRAVGRRPAFGGPPYWVRVRETVADDPITRACVLAYMSDIGLMAAARPDGFRLDFSASEEERRARARNAASLDHAIWFHRPFDPNAWNRYEAIKLNSNGALGLVIGSFYDANGSLIASTSQEALWRV